MLLKQCNGCGPKPPSDFFKRRDTKDGLAYSCKSCTREYLSKYRKIYNQTGAHRNCLRRNKEYLYEAKNHPCTDCGLKYEPYCMEFDHVRGIKLGDVGILSHGLVSIETLRTEIEKCELVCVLCHRDRTHKRNTPRTTKNLHSQRNRDLVINLKSNPCSVCEVQYPYWMMDFDHVRGVNLFGISRVMCSQRHSLKKLTAEIQKCQLLCALCHRRKTFKERGIDVI